MANKIVALNGARQAEEASVKEVIGRLADELNAATVMAEDCQEALGEALGEVFGREIRRDLAERLQRLDELTQRLADLAELVERLASGSALGVAPVGVFEGLKLSDLKMRLSGGRVAAVSAGELELW